MATRQNYQVEQQRRFAAERDRRQPQPVQLNQGPPQPQETREPRYVEPVQQQIRGQPGPSVVPGWERSW